MIEQKNNLRSETRDKLKSLTCSSIEKSSKKITVSIVDFIQSLQQENITLGSFSALMIEPDLSSLHTDLKNVQIAYPLCHDRSNMDFYQVADPSTLRTGMHGILEPDPLIHPPISPEDLDVILCPAYAYELSNKKRLGKGGGYYDRYSEKTEATLIGVVFHSQLVLNIPCEPHDCAVDAIVTEQGFHQ